MINFETFLLGLLVVSTFTSLATEAVKFILNEYEISYRSNTLVGIVAAVLSGGIGIGYLVMNEIGFSGQTITYLVALIVLSWLSAMVGYDKVIQAIGQFKSTGRDE